MVNNILDKFLDAFYAKSQEFYGKPEVTKLVDAFFEKVGKFTENFYSIQDQVLALGRMLRAWSKQEYSNISPASIATLIAAILYFVNPFDFIPDFIPFIGKIDDFLIISLVVKRLNKEIERFMAWENEQQTSKNY
jgi:uncharacterized membrane protein YkvA (DUF1232 family)